MNVAGFRWDQWKQMNSDREYIGCEHLSVEMIPSGSFKLFNYRSSDAVEENVQAHAAVPAPRLDYADVWERLPTGGYDSIGRLRVCKLQLPKARRVPN